MEELEVNGRTVDEAVEKALEQLGLTRSEVDVEVLSQGRPGLFGLGGENARVMVRPLTSSRPSVVDESVEVLKTLLSLLGLEARVTVRPPQTLSDRRMEAVLDVWGDDLGILIGRRGETLATLQYMVNLIVSRHFKSRYQVGIDVEGYRRRREDALRNLALRLAEKVKTSGRPVTLEPMPANERRIVHLALVDDAQVVTTSIGEGESRKVVISVRRQPAAQR